MKRGQLPLEAVIGVVLRVLGVALLAALVVGLVRVLVPSGDSPEEMEFKRVVNDFEKVMEEQYRGEDIILNVPITRPITVVAYSGGAAARPQCGGKPCICLEGEVLKCETFPALKAECPALCEVGAKASCIVPSVAELGKNVVTIKRGCNEIGFVGVQV